MAQSSYKPQLIEIEIQDRQIDHTFIKQKVRFVKLSHEQMTNGEGRVLVDVLVTMFSIKQDGSYGKELTGDGFVPRPVQLVADNQTIVNSQTGEILIIKTGYTPEEVEALVAALTVDWMYQGDFFNLLRDNVEINISDMIKQHIRQADQMGKFAYV